MFLDFYMEGGKIVIYIISEEINERDKSCGLERRKILCCTVP